MRRETASLHSRQLKAARHAFVVRASSTLRMDRVLFVILRVEIKLAQEGLDEILVVVLDRHTSW